MKKKEENTPKEPNIQWFPGHMKKAERMIAEMIRLVDAVCELRDARIPTSSRNPDVDELTAGKPRLVILNRADQADPAATSLWRERLRTQGVAVLETDSRSGRGVKGFAPAIKTLLAEELARREARGQGGRVQRVMVLGIPNVGKSSFINRLAGRRAAEAGDRPGVTRGRQWISVGQGLELLDTPGILWPRFETPEEGLALAWTGAIRDDVLDVELVASRLLERLRELYPAALHERYGLDIDDAPGWELLERCAKRRGFLVSRGEFDTERMSRVLLDEFRAGKLGRITLERP